MTSFNRSLSVAALVAALGMGAAQAQTAAPAASSQTPAVTGQTLPAIQKDLGKTDAKAPATKAPDAKAGVTAKTGDAKTGDGKTGDMKTGDTKSPTGAATAKPGEQAKPRS